jgi:hypothetical protein
MKEGRQVVGREEFLSDRRPNIISAVTPCLTGCCSVPTPRSTVLSVDNPPSLQLNRFAMTADASTQPTDTAATSKVSASSPPGKQAPKKQAPKHAAKSSPTPHVEDVHEPEGTRKVAAATTAKVTRRRPNMLVLVLQCFWRLGGREWDRVPVSRESCVGCRIIGSLHFPIHVTAL